MERAERGLKWTKMLHLWRNKMAKWEVRTRGEKEDVSGFQKGLRAHFRTLLSCFPALQRLFQHKSEFLQFQLKYFLAEMKLNPFLFINMFHLHCRWKSPLFNNEPLHNSWDEVDGWSQSMLLFDVGKTLITQLQNQGIQATKAHTVEQMDALYQNREKSNAGELSVLGFRLRCSTALKYLENPVPPDNFSSKDVLSQSKPGKKLKVRATKHWLLMACYVPRKSNLGVLPPVLC